MKIIRKILALVIALCMAIELPVMPGNMQAQKVQAAVTSGNYEYVVLDEQAGTIRITKYSGTEAVVTIPSEIDGKSVVEIGANAFEKCSNLTDVHIPDSVTSIESYAFYECRNLTGVGIPSSVKIIGGHAFAVCQNLSEVIIENGLTQIRDEAFYYCVNLTEITIPDSVAEVGYGAFEGCPSIQRVYYSGTEEQWEKLGIEATTGEEVFKDATIEYGYVLEADAAKIFQYQLIDNNKSIEILKYIGPDSNAVVNIPRKIGGWDVTSIGAGAFERCAKLKKIVLPDNVTNIGNSAFAYCEGLAEITLSANLTRIRCMAFYECSSLREIDLPYGITSIENDAFLGCTGLRKISIPDSVTSISLQAFSDCSSLEEISIPDGVQVIDYQTFSKCQNLSKINMPASVTTIKSEAFIQCHKLKGIKIPENVKSIGSNAFHACESLTDEISIPDGVADINEGTFSMCRKLTEISIPLSVKNIKDSAFYDCTCLTDVYYAGTADQWGEIDISTSYNEPLLNATIHCAGSGDFLYKDMKYKILDGTVEVEGYIGDGVLAYIDISNTINGMRLTSIGKSCFAGCDRLYSITIQDNIEKIMENAFDGCTSLTEVYYSGTKSQWEKIKIDPTGNEVLSKATIHYAKPDELTSGDYRYKILDDGTIEITKYVGADTKTEAQIPEKINEKNVASIGISAFAGCEALQGVSIPVSVTSIKENAFLGCTNLSVVEYSGTKKQWDKINISEAGNEPLRKTSTIHYMFGDYRYVYLTDGTVEITKYVGSDTAVDVPEKIDGRSVTVIGMRAFEDCKDLKKVNLPDSVNIVDKWAFRRCQSLTEINFPDKMEKIDQWVFSDCTSLKEITIPDNLKTINVATFYGCKSLKTIIIPSNVTIICALSFFDCTGLSDVYYKGTKDQWQKINILTEGNDPLHKAVIHYNSEEKPTPPDTPDEPQIENVITAKQALESLKAGDALSLEPAFQPYLSPEQIDVMESYLYTWLAEINYAYKYSGNNGTKERIMKKAGIDPDGDFASGKEQAITHISVGTRYGQKTFEVTLNLGKPDSSGNLYPAYGTMHYEVIPKGDIPTDVPKTGQIGKTDYTDMGGFIQYISKAAEDSLHGTYQWQSLNDEMTAGVLVDKTLAEIIGNKNGSFSDGTFVIYAEPLSTYSKKVTIACPVDVHVYTMDGKEAGSIVNNKKNEKDGNVGLHVEGDKKTVYLTGNDYYLSLRGTDTGKMRYEVEEIANDKVCRDVQFLELQLKKDLQYEGYVFRPLNIDSDLYALRRIDGSSKDTVLSDKDTYEALFKKVQGLSLSRGEAVLDQNRSVQLSASLYPLDASNQSLQWTTNNQSVLSVDGNGLVTAVGAGSATVTVSTRDGSFLKQYCVINVKSGNSNSSNNSGNSVGSSGNSGGSSGSGNNSGNSANGSGSSENNSDIIGNNPDDSKPSFEPETPPVVVALHYVLQFQTNGGINLSRKTMTLLADDNPGIMPKIQRKGYVFDGWYTQQNGGEQVKGDEPLKAAATLYAHWTKAKAPKKVSAPTLKSKKKGQMKVAFKKVKGAAGYQLQYSTKKGFASKKTKQIGASAKAKTISGLKAGKEYYARVRAYSTDSMGNKLYGKYSKVKGVKIHP